LVSTSNGRKCAPTDDHAARPVGQQRPHLLGVARVVQQDQHPPALQQAPIQVGLGEWAGRNPVRRDALGLQQLPDRVLRLDDRTALVEPAQVQVELAVREPRREVVGEPDRQRRLADACHARHHGDHRVRQCVGRVRAIDQRGQPGQFGAATGEDRQVGR
jgi:hypothetical protein